MKKMLIALAALTLIGNGNAGSAPATRHAIRVKGTHFMLDDAPFPFTGYSFFNAIFNPTFNQSPAVRREWLARLQKYKINVLRIWCQWGGRPYADAGPSGVIGELSQAAAAKLGIPTSPINGGVASGVTYIVFTGANYVDPIENLTTADTVGKNLAAKLIADNK